MSAEASFSLFLSRNHFYVLSDFNIEVIKQYHLSKHQISLDFQLCSKVLYASVFHSGKNSCYLGLYKKNVGNHAYMHLSFFKEFERRLTITI